jgi:hypothetical protein
MLKICFFFLFQFNVKLGSDKSKTAIEKHLEAQKAKKDWEDDRRARGLPVGGD